MKSDLYKFGWFPDGWQQDGSKDARFEYPNIWTREKTSGPDRIAIAPSSDYTPLLQKLADLFELS